MIVSKCYDRFAVIRLDFESIEIETRIEQLNNMHILRGVFFYFNTSFGPYARYDGLSTTSGISVNYVLCVLTGVVGVVVVVETVIVLRTVGFHVTYWPIYHKSPTLLTEDSCAFSWLPISSRFYTFVALYCCCCCWFRCVVNYFIKVKFYALFTIIREQLSLRMNI